MPGKAQVLDQQSDTENHQRTAMRTLLGLITTAVTAQSIPAAEYAASRGR